MENSSNPKDLDQLISFIREEIGEFNLEIKLSSLLEDELGITGDDGLELIQNYGIKFNVNIADFQYKKYFYPEPSIFNSIGKISPFTVGDLYLGIKSGKLK